jgi:hypothetical protein
MGLLELPSGVACDNRFFGFDQLTLGGLSIAAFITVAILAIEPPAVRGAT